MHTLAHHIKARVEARGRNATHLMAFPAISLAPNFPFAPSVEAVHFVSMHIQHQDFYNFHQDLDLDIDQTMTTAAKQQELTLLLSL